MPSEQLVYLYYTGTNIPGSGFNTTCTVTNGSATVTGQFTIWETAIDKGDVLFVGGNMGLVLNRVSDTELTLAAPWAVGREVRLPRGFCPHLLTVCIQYIESEFPVWWQDIEYRPCVDVDIKQVQCDEAAFREYLVDAQILDRRKVSRLYQLKVHIRRFCCTPCDPLKVKANIEAVNRLYLARKGRCHQA
jgi:hypothetical protein